jgi:thiosulfate dehydrogenase
MLPSRTRAVILAFAVVTLAACSQPASTTQQPLTSAVATVRYDPSALPAGPLGVSIRLGHDIIADPHKYLPNNVVSDMSCAACHLGVGTVPRGGSFIGTYGRFPQWNKRAKRVIALQDRLAECFLYSMNGTPPSYNGKEMIAMVSYIAYLSRKVPTGQKATDSFIVPLPEASPDLKHGAKIYAQSCESCHQASGAGVHGAFPPLWGPTSFNAGAGMAHIDRMTGFVRFNMPQNAPGSLTLEDAYDVSAWVLTHSRPAFKKQRSISQEPEPANYF